MPTGFSLAKNTAHQLPRPNRASRPENTLEYSIRRGDWRAVLVGLFSLGSTFTVYEWYDELRVDISVKGYREKNPAWCRSLQKSSGVISTLESLIQQERPVVSCVDFDCTHHDDPLSDPEAKELLFALWDKPLWAKKLIYIYQYMRAASSYFAYNAIKSAYSLLLYV